jgi:uncharacterized protein involved in outer membrane biogenesis
MEEIMKKFLIIIIVLIVIFGLTLAGLYMFRDNLLKVAIEKGIEHTTGLDITIGNIKTDIRKTNITINNLLMNNPKDFKDRVMVDMPHIYADYNLSALMQGDIHLYSMIIDIKECSVVKNKDGKLNLDYLKPIQDMADQAKAIRKPQADAPDFRIDNLELKIGRVYYKDYSSGPIPHTLQFDLNMDEKFSDITDADTIVNLIVFKAIMNTTIGSLIRLDINSLRNNIGNTLSTAQNVAGRAVQSTAKTATDAAGKVLTLPFKK